MKKIVLSVVLVLLALGLFTGIVAAQGIQSAGNGSGPLHTYIEQALADRLDLTLAQVEAQFDAGKTLAQIALDNGIAAADLPAFMQGVHETAFAAAVADGVITQAQADWMLQRMAQKGYGNGTGICPMGGGLGQRGDSRFFGMGMRGFRFSQSNP